MAISSLKRTTSLFARTEQVIVLFMPVLLFLVPLNSIDGHFTFCVFKNIFGHDCPGCGMTHAIISAMHFHFIQAWHYNKLVVVVLPLLAYLWVKEFVKFIK